MANTRLDDWALEGIKTPQVLQSYILDKFSEASDSKFVITDPNNVAAFLVEAFATMGSNVLRRVDDSVLPAIYPSRAISTADLYKHLSDYDYVGIFSYPAQATIMMIFDVSYLMTNGIPVDAGTSSSVRQLIIPETTHFTVGQYDFGLYYPIKLRVSPTTRMFVAEYDTTKTNPLKVLSTNTLEYELHKSNGLTYAFVTIPVYQFSTSTTVEPLVNGSGYRRVIDYTDKFYAIKCTAETFVEGEGWAIRELALSMSGRTYDPDEPTAVFTVDVDNNQCIVEIPYVYFTKEIIRGNLRVDIYTTKGRLNYTVPADTADFVTIDMFSSDLDSTVAKFVEPFRTMPGLEAHPYTEQITGGSNGYSYEELRRRIINDSFGMKVLQTPKDVETYFSNEGYVVSLYKDGITDRVYNAHATLRWTDDSIVACASIDTLITKSTLDESRTVIRVLDNTYTILPSTRYKLDVDSGLCVPLTDSELQNLNDMPLVDRVKAFNTNEYTICPFHIQVSTASKYPTTAVFDLTDADIDSNVFLTSRERVDKSLSVSSALMEVVPTDYTGNKDMTTDKYRLTINVTRSGLDNVTAVMLDEGVEGVKQFRVLVGIKKLDGSFIFAEADYIQRSGNVDVFRMDISATAAFTQVGNEYAVRLKAPFTSAEEGVDVLLTSEVRIVLLLRKLLFSDNVVITQDYLSSDFTNSGLDDLPMFSAVCENRLIVHFGKLLNELDARMSLMYSDEKYREYETTEFKVLEHPIYETVDGTPNGVPRYDVNALENEGKLVLIEKYPVGTLEAFTHTIDQEQLTLSKLFYTNIKGCKFITDPVPGNADIRTSGVLYNQWPDNTITAMEGVVATVYNVPVMPKFSVTAATMNTSGVNECIGDYFLADILDSNGVPKAKASSSESDRWYKVFKDESGHAAYYEVKPMDALQFVLDYALSIKENASLTVVDGVEEYYKKDHGNNSYEFLLPDGDHGKYKTNPLSGVDAREGMFVFVVNDSTAISRREYESLSVAKLSKGEATSETTSALYFYKDGEWHLVLTFSSDSKNTYTYGTSGTRGDKSAFIEWAELILKDLRDVVADEYSSGIRHGYVYMIHRVKVSISNGDVTVSDYDWEYPPRPVISPFQYVAFMNKDSDDIPVFVGINSTVKYVPLDPLTTRADSSATYNIIHPDTGEFVEITGVSSFEPGVVYYNKVTNLPAWDAYVNRWPWEVSEWRKLNRIEDSDTGAYAYTYTVDNLFAAAMDKYRLTPYCKYVAGQYRLDSDGKPYVETPRQLQYLLNMLQVDAKLAETSIVKSTRSYPRNLVSLMRTHFSNLSNIKNRLYTNTKLFFEPMKSIGYGQFYTDGETTTEYPLDITMGFKLHVSAEIAGDDTMLNNLRMSVISIIDDHMAEGGCSMTAIAELIKQNNSDSVRYVDVLGINGDQKLQTMRCVNPEVRPHLKHTLELEDDGITVTLQRGLTLEFVVANE